MSRPKGPYHELALAIVESAPGACGRDAIVHHVSDALERFAREQRTLGALEARERMLREQLAYARGLQQDASNRARIAEQDLEELLALRR